MNKAVKILIAVVVIVVGLNFFKNSIVQSALVAGLSSATHVPVHIGSTNAKFLSGSIDIRNIRVSNPSNFPERTMLDAPQVAVAFDPSALKQHIAHFKEVTVNLKELVVIKNRDGSLNIDAIKPKQQDKKAEEKKGQVIQLQIDTLHLTIGRVLYKDYSGGGEPAVQTFDLNINNTYQNINNPASLVSLIMFEALRNTTLSRILDLDLDSYKNMAQGMLTNGLGFATEKGASLIDKGSGTVGETASKVLNIFK